MIRKIIKIDADKCNGCGACAEACHEGAIGMVEGKAVLLREDYCDGLGDCLPACPADAISFEEREAAAYDETAVRAHQKKTMQSHIFSGCPGSRAAGIRRPGGGQKKEQAISAQSQLMQWPVQIQLAPENAAYFENANLLIAADCTAYAYGAFHERFIKNHITLIGCPKLDAVEYTEKLTRIIQNNNIRSVAIVRMEVPCCGGLEYAAKTALQNSGKWIPWQVYTITTDGRILS